MPGQTAYDLDVLDRSAVTAPVRRRRAGALRVTRRCREPSAGPAFGHRVHIGPRGMVGISRSGEQYADDSADGQESGDHADAPGHQSPTVLGRAGRVRLTARRDRDRPRRSLTGRAAYRPDQGRLPLFRRGATRVEPLGRADEAAQVARGLDRFEADRDDGVPLLTADSSSRVTCGESLDRHDALGRPRVPRRVADEDPTAHLSNHAGPRPSAMAESGYSSVTSDSLSRTVSPSSRLSLRRTADLTGST